MVGAKRLALLDCGSVTKMLVVNYLIRGTSGKNNREREYVPRGTPPSMIYHHSQVIKIRQI